MRSSLLAISLALFVMPVSSILAYPVEGPPAQRLMHAPLVVRGRVIDKLPGDEVTIEQVPAVLVSTLPDVAKVAVDEVLKGRLDRTTILLRDLPRRIESPGAKLDRGQRVLLFLNETASGYAVSADGAVDLDASPGWLPMARATLALLDQEPGNDEEARTFVLTILSRFERLSDELKIFALSIVFGSFEDPKLLISPSDELLISVLRQSRVESSIEVRQLAVQVAAWRVEHATGVLRDALVGHVAAALADDTASIRSTAIRSLYSNLASPAIKKVVMEQAPSMLEDPNSSVRVWALRALQRLRFGVVSEERRQGYDPRIPPEQQREAIKAWRDWARVRSTPREPAPR